PTCSALKNLRPSPGFFFSNSSYPSGIGSAWRSLCGLLTNCFKLFQSIVSASSTILRSSSLSENRLVLCHAPPDRSPEQGKLLVAHGTEGRGEPCPVRGHDRAHLWLQPAVRPLLQPDA